MFDRLMNDFASPRPHRNDDTGSAALTQELTDHLAGAPVEGLLRTQDILFRFVDGMKEQGEPPEHVLVALKQAMVRADWQPGILASDRERARSALVQLCIERYFATGSITPSRRPTEATTEERSSAPVK
jgi:hypothetical protein